MAVRNVKHAFNRLFLVLSVAWAIYCTTVFPMSQRRKAFDHYQQDLRGCYERELDQGKVALDGCLKLAEDEWHTSVDQWSVKNFYVGAWSLILAAILGLPLLVYGAVRGIAAFFLWIWRGYQTEPKPS